jgi:hypothetical protein
MMWIGGGYARLAEPWLHRDAGPALWAARLAEPWLHCDAGPALWAARLAEPWLHRDAGPASLSPPDPRQGAGVPLRIRQRRARPSYPAVSRNWPSGENTAALT